VLGHPEELPSSLLDPQSGLPLTSRLPSARPLVLPRKPTSPLETGFRGQHAARRRRRRHLVAMLLPETFGHHLAVVGAGAAAEGRRSTPGPTSPTRSTTRTLQLTCKTPGSWTRPGTKGHLVTTGEGRPVASHRYSRAAAGQPARPCRAGQPADTTPFSLYSPFSCSLGCTTSHSPSTCCKAASRTVPCQTTGRHLVGPRQVEQGETPTSGVARTPSLVSTLERNTSLAGRPPTLETNPLVGGLG